MAGELFRVVRTLTTTEGQTVTASDPIPRDVAMRRFDEMAVAWRMDRVRVVRECDYKPALFGAQTEAR